jgi:aminoglycoside phosphotransferase (APT) family kinase protein
VSLRGKLGMLRTTARVAGHYAADRVRRGPVGPDAVPPSPEAATPAWLTAHLCAAVPGARVERVEVLDRTDGTSSRRRIAVTYNAEGRAAGLPERLFVKSTPTLLTRLVCGMNDLLSSEAHFYDRLRSGLAIEAPTGYVAVYDDSAARSLFLLEDIAETRGARFAGPAERYVDRAMAEDMVDLMATYHARFWDVDHARELPWLPDARRWFLHTHDMMNVDKLSRNGVRRAAEVLPPELVERADELWPAFLASLDAAVTGPGTALHQDVHAGNWYVTGEGRMGLYDWQCMAVGNWAIDVSYALMSALTVTDRRAWERDLVGRYLTRLAELGVGGAPSEEQAWLDYRRQALHGLVFWLVTIGVSRMQPDMQPRAVCLANLERMGRAVLDLDTLGAFRDR